MYHSLPALTLVLALQSLAVAASALYLREPASMVARGNNGNGNGASSTTTSTTSSNDKHSTSTTDTSTTHSSSTSTTPSSSSSSSPTHSSSPSTTHSSSSTTQSSSISTTATTGTLTSTSLSYASTTGTSSSSSAQSTQHGLTSTSSQGLSTTARTGLAFGIMFFLILSAMLFCYLKRRSRRAREKAGDRPAVLSPEISQYRPPNPVASPERELPPSLRLGPAYPESSNISRHSANSSIVPLLSDDSRRNSHPASAWNRHSTLSQATDTQPVTMEDVPPLPNPHDSFSAPAHSATYASTTVSMATSSPHRNAYDASVPANAATLGTIAAPVVGSSSTSQPQPLRRLSALHIDLTRHQKELELEHRKQSLDAQEPPPQYSS
ncbi:hypothetical protein DFH29DRAFT_1043354 [Suillus ampliporus]|nr:hypothetical protein DFH29DRAFT_1043354 [Suillus ampliporus]